MAIIPNDEKVFMVSNTTNTTYSGSQALKDMNEWYTMEDVKNTVLPYKVYTALLTQIGEDDPDSLTSGAVTKGVTYTIAGTGVGDFTNVGAPSNQEGTSFVAINNDVPNDYGNGGLSFNGGAPVVTVLENTIGNIWFTYQDVGIYYAFSNSLFIQNKTFSPNSQTRCFSGGDLSYILSINYQNNSVVNVNTVDDDLNRTDDALTQKLIEIRVYN
jgi:hypothetical protein